jgi:hypothetical protein
MRRRQRKRCGARACHAPRSNASSPRSCAGSFSRRDSRHRAVSSISCSDRSPPALRLFRRAAWERSQRNSQRTDVRTGAAVATVGPHAVSLESGEQLRANAVVVATAGLVDEPAHGWNGVTCVYYEAPAAPIPGPWLIVNGEGGPVTNLCFPSEVVESYAPPGRALASLTILGGNASPISRPSAGSFAAGSAPWSPRGATCGRTGSPGRFPRTRRRLRKAAGAPCCRVVRLRRPPRASFTERRPRIRPPSRRSRTRRRHVTDPPPSHPLSTANVPDEGGITGNRRFPASGSREAGRKQNLLGRSKLLRYCG